MEERRMKKYFLIGASMLLLAAGTSCNRQLEKDVLPADGMVTLRFTAVVEETRTAYEGDKTASWVAGDRISVYVTNGTDGQAVTFTADESLTFTAQVPVGYETIVAGAYPADAAHTFDASGVATLHLPASYTLTADDDPASVIPLVGTYADGQMTFRHTAGVLKFTIENVPASAVRFNFTTFGDRINGSFSVDPTLEDTVVDAEKSVDILFPAGTQPATRSFYVPVPAGELYPESVISLYDADDKILFKKVVPAALTVNKNVVKRIAAVSGWTRNEDWQAAYLRDVYSTSTQKFGSYVQITGTTGLYDNCLYATSTFNNLYGSVEAFLASNYIPNQKANGRQPRTKNLTINYNRLSPGSYTVVLYSVDENYNFTGEYNIVEIEVPQFTTPESWTLTFNPTYKLSNGEVHPAVHVQVPEGTSWAGANLKKDAFLDDYGGDALAYIWSRTLPTASVTIRTSKDINLYFSSLDETDYVYIVYGVREPEQTGGNRILTYEYALLEYTYTAPSDEPTDAYNAWLGQWSVADGTNTDTWTIAADKNNETYSITGLVGRASSTFAVAGVFNDDGTLQINAQMDIRTFNGKMSDGNTYEASLGLFGRKEASGSFYTYKSNPYPLVKATMNGSDNNAATLAPAGETYFFYTFVASYVNANGESKWAGYGTRPATATMTRVTSDGVLAPDGWAEEAEQDTPDSAPVFDGTEVVEAE